MTNATNTTATKSISDAQLNKISKAALGLSVSEQRSDSLRAATIKIVSAAGIGETRVAVAFKVGFMAGQLMSKGVVTKWSGVNAAAEDKAMEAALTQWGRVSLTAKNKKGAKRSKAGQAAYMAANTAWGRVLKEAKVKSENPAGAKPGVSKPKKTKAPKTASVPKDEPVVVGASAAIPAITSRQDTINILQAEAAWLTGMMKKASASIQADGQKASSVQMRNAVSEFAKAVKELSAASKSD